MPVLAAFMVPHPPMIVPAVGRGSEKQIGATAAAYDRVGREIAALRPETVIIASPHTVMYSDYFHIAPGSSARGSFSDFRAREVRFREDYDAELVKKIEEIAEGEHFPAGTLGERGRDLDHGVMVPLWFIRKYCDGFKLVRLGLSGLPLPDHYRLGQMIRRAVEETGRRAVFVASGDLSHKLQEYGPYGFAKEGPEYDARIMDVCSRAAFGELFGFSETFCEKASECGHRSFVIMAGVLDGLSVEAEQLSHEDVTGVGYGICTFYPKGEDPERKFLDRYLAEEQEKLRAAGEKSDAYVRLARAAVEAYVRRRETLRLRDLGSLPEEMLKKRAGVFVSLHKHGSLRGCIGTFLPAEGSIAEEIIANGISACSRDPRFDRVTPDELPFLEISVDVLGTPEKIRSELELDPKRYGVIVSFGAKRGLLLPDLPGVDTVARQIAIAKQKAGIGPGEPVSLQRFEVVRHV